MVTLRCREAEASRTAVRLLVAEFPNEMFVYNLLKVVFQQLENGHIQAGMATGVVAMTMKCVNSIGMQRLV